MGIYLANKSGWISNVWDLLLIQLSLPEAPYFKSIHKFIHVLRGGSAVGRWTCNLID